SADGRGVHTVLIDGKVVVENGHCTTIDEDKLWADAQQMGESITSRSGLPDKSKFPML
ncbi:MAG: amidohydrolase, partial [Actinobacteria bacterium]|nr:amidohydrolase [Actinomycetota bacterium]